MNEVDKAQRELAEEFAFLGDWMERYQYLIDLGRRLPALDDAERVDANKIRGCQSQVWFVGERDGDRLHFRANSDAAIVSGLIAILLKIYSGRRPEDILAAGTGFVTELGFEQHLSPTRSNGLAAMLETIQQHAVDASASA